MKRKNLLGLGVVLALGGLSAGSSAADEELIPIAVLDESGEYPIKRDRAVGRWFALVPDAGALVVFDVPKYGAELKVAVAREAGESVTTTVFEGALRIEQGRVALDGSVHGFELSATALKRGIVAHGEGSCLLPGDPKRYTAYLFFNAETSWARKMVTVYRNAQREELTAADVAPRAQ